MAGINLVDLTKSYGDTRVLHHIEGAIDDGEFISHGIVGQAQRCLSSAAICSDNCGIFSIHMDYGIVVAKQVSYHGVVSSGIKSDLNGKCAYRQSRHNLLLGYVDNLKIIVKTGRHQQVLPCRVKFNTTFHAKGGIADSDNTCWDRGDELAVFPVKLDN